MNKILLFFLFLFGPALTMAQSYDKEFETVFLWEVKQIDEFIDRFNNSDKTLIKEYYKKKDPAITFTREELIKSLFNTEDKTWNFNEITNFIDQVTSKENPEYLNFFGKNWYATVKCAVTYRGMPKYITLFLTVQGQSNGSSKWIIIGADANFLRLPEIKQHLLKIPKPRDSTKSLNPVSNATEFLNIDLVSRDKANIKNYFLQSDNYNDDLPLVENEILNSQLIINKSIAVSYDFKQIPGWEIEIKQYNRQTKNSGWLISKLKRITD
jgi:hypothetical protein